MDDTSFFLLYSLVGALAALLSGLVGIGGATLFVPVLMWALPQRGVAEASVVPMAFATSMVCVLILTACSVWQHHRLGNVCWARFQRVTPFACAGALAGIIVLFTLHPSGQNAVFGLFLLWMALNMWLNRDQQCPAEEGALSWRRSARQGSIAGMFSGLVGIAGAVMLSALLRKDVAFRRSIGTAAAISLPVALVGVLGYGYGNAGGDWQRILHQYDWLAVLGLTIPAFICTRFGVRLGLRLPVARLRRLFSGLVGALAVVVLAKAVLLA